MISFIKTAYMALNLLNAFWTIRRSTIQKSDQTPTIFNFFAIQLLIIYWCLIKAGPQSLSIKLQISNFI